MTPRAHKLLVADDSEDLFDLIRTLTVRGFRPDRSTGFDPERCPPHQLENWLRQYDADALVVTQSRFEENLPAAVKRWKSIRPHLQVLFLFERLPHTRALVDLMRA